MPHGLEGEERRRRWRHMWPVPAPGTAATAAAPPPPAPPAVVVPAADSNHSSPDSFLKDGRKICVGDCALFQAGNSPPFIGIIRWFSPGKENCLKLGVNWLYRPADIKLAKGNLLEAAPNEVFYSFHRDEISAESLLHPCKVTFLCKGVELPSGIASFVCRRVYDIANKCLWWLTDQDYINERQEEVDQLLDKTRLEMHAAVQSGGRSPKQLNGPQSTPQLKSGADSVQNSGTSFPSQAKGKKRGERGDLGSEPIKRERFSKSEDGDSGNFKLDNMIRAEIAKITDKGGLTNTEGVERLVHLMQLERVERKIDLSSRVLLADVIAATDRNDCLGRFVQLRGVPVLDDWLQEAHKGKTGDGSSPKESDKSVEELLLALLRALDKLPVNLNALQTCNIGKSVNHLRSHKNLEIQKKARSLVDTWKKRVDAEMTKLNDAKSIGSSQAISWPGRSGFSEVSYGGNRRTGSTEIATKSSVAQPSPCKTVPVKIGHGDSIMKSTPAPAGSLKLPSALSSSMPIGLKDSQCKAAGGSGTTEQPLTTIKEEKSSSSSQSQNNSQSCSSDHGKTMGSSWKEDARSSTAGSVNATRTSGGTSRHRKSTNGFLGTGVSGVQKDTGLSKSGSLNRSTTSEKVSQSGLTGERTVDMPISDHGNSHRLIVRLPNPGRSPARSVCGGSFEDPSVVGSRASSPGIPEKHEYNDHKIKVKGDASQANISTDVNAESWQSNGVKGVVGSVDGDRSPAALLDEQHTGRSHETGKEVDMSRAACSSPANETGVFSTERKPGKSYEASLSSINALIESCVKCSEARTSLSVGDDLGMNLLASVAAGEMSKSDVVSPSGSPVRSSPAPEDLCTANEVKSKPSSDNVVPQVHDHPEHTSDADSGKCRAVAGPLLVREELLQNSANVIDDKSAVPLREHKSTGEHREQHSSAMVLCKAAEQCVKSEGKPDEETADNRMAADMKEDGSEDDATDRLREKQIASGHISDGLMDRKLKINSPSSDQNKSVESVRKKNSEDNIRMSDVVCSSFGGVSDIDHVAPSKKCDEESVEDTPLGPPLDKQNVADEGLHSAICTEQQLPPVVAVCPEAVNKDGDDVLASASSNASPEVVDNSRTENCDGLGLGGQSEPSDSDRKDHVGLAPKLDDQVGPAVLSTSNGAQENFERKEALKHHTSSSANHEEASVIPPHETKQCAKSVSSKISGPEAEEMGKVAASAEVSSSAISAVPEVATKLDFDLNEGFSGDEGNPGEPVPSAVHGSSSGVHLPNLSSFTISPMSSGSVPITVAAPAKGPFVPPETLLKSKGEPGWKGSAATSAFRPAEPRKILEMPLGTSDVPSSDGTPGKQGRPPLDIDLNVPDERVMEDIASQSSAQETGSESGATSNRDAPIRSSGGLDLDLNRADEGTENGQFSTSTSRRLEVPLLPLRPAYGGFPNVDAYVSRDFDLNNGPGLDEAGTEPVSRNQHARTSSIPFLPSHRMNNNELGSLFSWFPPGNSYPAVAIPSFLPDRGDQPYPVVAAPGVQRIMGSASGGGAFGGDLYRGPVLSSSPAMAFSPAAAFPYAGFPFGSSFPLVSTSFSGGPTAYVDSASGGGPCFPAIPSPLMGPASAASSPYVRPYVISLPEGSTGGGPEGSRKWSRQGLDLNAGPGSVDVEGRDERLPFTSRQLSVASPQAFAEEQARIYQVAGGGMKRKEPEGGWDAERFAFKQPSWQ